MEGEINKSLSHHDTLLAWTGFLSKAPSDKVVICQPNNNEVALMGELSAETLQQKGVKSELIQLALAETGFNWDEILKQVLMKKYGSAKISYSDQSARIFLQNRGFSYSQFEKYLSD